MNLAPGDIFEIVFDDGWGYARVLQQHPVYREVLAIDPKRYGQPVSDMETLSFSVVVMFPMADADRNGRFTLGRVVHGPQPPIDSLRFKMAVRDGTGKPIYWWVWNGDTVNIPPSESNLAALPERRVLSLEDFRMQFRA